MAKELNTKCRTCGGPVTPGCDYCSHHCKITAQNDKALKKAKAKAENKADKAKPTTDKDKE